MGSIHLDARLYHEQGKLCMREQVIAQWATVPAIPQLPSRHQPPTLSDGRKATNLKDQQGITNNCAPALYHVKTSKPKLSTAGALIRHCQRARQGSWWGFYLVKGMGQQAAHAGGGTRMPAVGPWGLGLPSGVPTLSKACESRLRTPVGSCA